jgi:nitronate monooxygenase
MALPAFLKDKLRLPAVGAPLFIISHPALVIAQCKAGIIGAFPALNARPISQLDEWLHEITEALAAHDRAHPEERAAPFAVNQIVHRSNARLEEDMALTVKWKAPIVITSLGAREDVNAAVHGYGGLTLHDIITNRFARKAIEKGADGLIAVAAGAGGHAGSISPFALIHDIRAWFDGPLLLSGAIATGQAILAAQAMGADLAYIGSAFIATEEARAMDAYKQAIVEGDASDIIGSNLFTGIFGNYLRPSIVNAGLDPDNLPFGDAKAMNFASRGSSDEGLARHLGQRPGHRRGQEGRAGRRTRRAAQARIRGSEEAHLRLIRLALATALSAVTIKLCRRRGWIRCIAGTTAPSDCFDRWGRPPSALDGRGRRESCRTSAPANLIR